MKDSNVVKLRHHFHFNIGIFIFVLILIYTFYFVIQYFRTDHILAYEVTEGSIVQNTTYTGIALRQESVVYSNSSGVVNFYVSSGDRVSVRSLVYSMDSDNVLSSLFERYADDLNTLSKDELDSFQELLENFTATYTNEEYTDLYRLTDSVHEELTEIKNHKALSLLSASGDASLEDALEFHYASTPGIVAFYTDGYESVTPETVNSFMFKKSSYEVHTVQNGSTIYMGNVVYKLITDESWQLVIPVSSSMAERLSEESSVEVMFLKDDISVWGDVSILYKQDGDYAVFTFSNSVSRYADDRFLDVKLNLDEVTGLKIPVSAITQKKFEVIPKEFLTKGGDSSQNGFIVQTTDEEGNTSVQFVPTTLYYETEDTYYISDSDIPLGSILIHPVSNNLYEVKNTAALTGVYNINKGYAIFKQIEVLFQNEEYAIVKNGTDYGLSQYDYIAIDAAKIYEGEIVR